MESSRRDLLMMGGAALAAGLASGCAQVARRLPGRDIPASLEAPSGDVDSTTRLINRAGFGPMPGQVAEVKALGHDAWVDQQLERKLGEDMRLQAQLMRLDVLRIDGMELRDVPEDTMVHQFNQALLLRATYSGDQLFERMVDFWGNHFNIYARKGITAYRKARDERDVIRKHALGSFPDMLRASAKSPAMLAYLDNQFSKKEAPNENYARELMELHSLGVHGGYTQKDVREVARCFTGWSIEKRFLRPKGTFLFEEEKHDRGAKEVLGHVIPAGGGVQDGERVLEILALHRQTARFVSGKMCRHFLGDSESPVRARLEKIYLETKGQVKPMLRELLLSDELLSGRPVAKRPLDYLVSALRAVGAESDCGPGLQQHLVKMGQSLYEWPMPDGYPDGAQPWTGSLLARWNFAFALCEGSIPGTDVRLKELAERTGQRDVTASVHEVIHSSEAVPKLIAQHSDNDYAKAAALMLSAPGFQWR
jgi:uncharacterized protein (DUF1800 family)